MAKKKAKKKTSVKKAEVEVKAEPKAEPKVEPKAEPAPAAALVPEQIVTVRGTSVGGVRSMTRSEYDKFNKQRGK